MRTGLFWAVGACLVAAAPSFAETPLPAASSESAASADPDGPPEEPDLFHYWVRAEYLAYWVKNAPLPVSLVTGDPANPTQELLNTDQSFGMFSGARVGFGAWFGCGNTFGWDGNYFGMQQGKSTFSASSDAASNPTLAFPFINQTPSAVGDTLMPIASPGVFAGSVQVASSLRFWGAETNGVLSVLHEGNFEFVALAGFRYLDLRESLNIGTVSSALLTDPRTVLTQNDLFDTRNEFYGGQIGGRVNWQGERFGLDLTGKLAIGSTHQSVDIDGTSTQRGPGGVNGTFPGGLFTQTSNRGSTSATQFTVIPSIELKFSAIITPRWRAFVGYDFLYWNRVVRPGSQIDRNINLSQSAVFGTGSLLGPASPTPLFNRSDFWAQGFNVGFEFRF